MRKRGAQSRLQDDSGCDGSKGVEDALNLRIRTLIRVSAMVAEQDQIERRACVQSALASQRMEGLEPDNKVIEDAQKWARGEMTIAAAVAAFKARLQLALA